MNIDFHDFKGETFSFHDDPVLVLENFWGAAERQTIRDAMTHAKWTALKDMPHVYRDFPNSGNWKKADMARPEAMMFLQRLTIPCIMRYMESFPDITGRHVNFNYYSYSAGDCLLTHDDMVQSSAGAGSKPAPLRRLAVVGYVHEEWNPDWGGELIIYAAKQISGRTQPELSVSHCILPKPGALVLFSVPRFHRVCRVDSVCGDQARLSIAGWLMTEHSRPVVPNS